MGPTAARRCHLRRVAIHLAALFLFASSPDGLAAELSPSIVIPELVKRGERNVTTEDLARVRDIDSLSLSPDGSRFAILVRQAVPRENRYLTAWFVGSLRGGLLTYAGEGGEERLLVLPPDGYVTGEFGGSVSRWSPDGRWIAYTVKRNAQVQLWRSRTDGRGQDQVTRNASDIRDFAWSDDGRALFFTASSTRAALAARREASRRSGIQFEEFRLLSRAINPAEPQQSLEPEFTVWRVDADGRDERVASEAERTEFEHAKDRHFSFKPGGVEIVAANLSGAVRPPVPREGGGAAWFVQSDKTQAGVVPRVRLVASLSADASKPIICQAPECEGNVFWKIWWSADGKEVLFWRQSGKPPVEPMIYAWSPSTGSVRTVLSAVDDNINECELAGDRIVCLRDTAVRPRHVVSVEVRSGRVEVVADVNPEFQSLRFAKVQRINWDLPPDTGDLGYGGRGRGYVLYPPDFDPAKRYPVFIAPYVNGGFLRGDLGDEHPLLVYAANGFIVVNSAFPAPWGMIGDTSDMAEVWRRTYDPARGFPHMTMYMNSTFRALDTAIALGGIDNTRVGIGGVSHGAFIPMWMVQNQDRLAALSVGSPGWSAIGYYFGVFPALTNEDPAARAWPASETYWSQIDLADHLDQIEAPMLFHLPDRELFSAGRLVRRMRDAHLPVDAYSFVNELHLKWQPSHRLAIYNRNLDWFRFWLQDVEDPDPAKAAQYVHWRLLRQQQCRNKRSLRDYCHVVSTPATAR